MKKNKQPRSHPKTSRRKNREAMHVPVDETFFQGAISAQQDGDAVYPCRLPLRQKHLFPSPGELLWQKAFCPSGVRLRLDTDAEDLTLHFTPLPGPGVQGSGTAHCFDAVVANEILQVVPCEQGAAAARFDRIGRGRRVLEIWLPPGTKVGVQAFSAPGASVLRPVPDRRPMWVTWGSSLTHCTRAGSAARVWPATVARRHDLNLVNLGFGGCCLLEPMVAMLIRDLPAQFISLKLGINALANLSERLYAPLVAGAVQIIREKHPHTPLALISPMASPPRESTPAPTGYTLEGMRRDMAAVHRDLVAAGDRNLLYVDGMDFFGLQDIAGTADDQLHPGAEGIDLQARRFSELVMPFFLGDAGH